MPKLQLERSAFWAVLFLSILPVFFIDFWVTGDGPCHLYNSKIIADWQWHGLKDFYKPFMFVNEHIEPNWISNLIQIPLLQICSVGCADKTFFLLYLLAFSFGFRQLVIQINPKAVFLAPLGALFAVHNLLMKGYTNHAWSLAIGFWIMALWLRNLENRKVSHYLGMTFGFMFLYLSHPFGFAFGLFSIVSAMFFYGIFTYHTQGMFRIFHFWKEQAIKIILCGFPGLILFLQFLLRRTGGEAPTGNVSSPSVILNDLLSLNCLMSLSSRERDILKAIAILTALLTIIAIFQKIKNRRLGPWDGLFIPFLGALGLVFFAPPSFAGGLEVNTRLSMIIFLNLIIWLATTDFPKIVRQVAAVAAVVIAAGLTQVRLPIQIQSSALAAEVMEANKHIKDRTILLSLNYDWHGQTPDGRVIANQNWLFRHVSCYLGAQKPIIISDNYELSTWYFPLIERSEKSLYIHTDREGMNTETRPPRADFLNYARRTGGQYDIDYVLLISYRPEFAEHPYTKEIFEQLKQSYQEVFRSQNGRAILYKNNNQPQ